ncbi:MAG: DUF4412 domain-containing protein [Bacteroidota bacterium]
MKSFLIVLMAILMAAPAEAQLLKRFKNKVENKVNRKVDKAMDDVIDEALDGPDNTQQPKQQEAKTTTQQTIVNNDKDKRQDFGDAMLNHPQKGQIAVGHLGQVTLEQEGDHVVVYGSWFTHVADIFDGFKLTLYNTGLDENGQLSKTDFQLSSEAIMKIAFDPSMPVNDNSDVKRAVTDEYENYTVETGTLSITESSTKGFSFSFTTSQGLTGQANTKDPRVFVEEVSIVEETEDLSNFQIPSTGGAKFGDQVNRTFSFDIKTENLMTNLKTKESYKMDFYGNNKEGTIAMIANMSDFSDAEMQGESIVVMYEGNMLMLVETEGMKMQMAPQAGMTTPGQEEFEDFDLDRIKKTGNTKTILGYQCEEYTFTDDDGNVMNYWLAPDLTDIPSWFGSMAQNLEENPFKGAVLEFEAETEEGTVRFTTTSIDRKASKTVDASQYKKMF